MSPTEAAYDRPVTFLAEPAGNSTTRTETPPHPGTTDPVTVETVDRAGIRSVSVSGRLVVRHIAPVRPRLAAALEVEQGELVLDLSGLDDLDAAGLVSITMPLMACRRRGVPITVIEPCSPDASRLLTLTGVLPSLTAAPTPPRLTIRSR